MNAVLDDNRLNVSRNELKSFMDRFDKDKDGKVTYDEVSGNDAQFVEEMRALAVREGLGKIGILESSVNENDLTVELVLGFARGTTDLDNPTIVPLTLLEEQGKTATFTGEHRLERSGSWAYGLRLRAGDGVELENETIMRLDPLSR